jgi:hypothetical protein
MMETRGVGDISAACRRQRASPNVFGDGRQRRNNYPPKREPAPITVGLAQIKFLNLILGNPYEFSPPLSIFLKVPALPLDFFLFFAVGVPLFLGYFIAPAAPG